MDSDTLGRVAYLVASGKARPEEILLLAFGNKAAKEMQERLQQRLGIEGALAGNDMTTAQRLEIALSIMLKGQGQTMGVNLQA